MKNGRSASTGKRGGTSGRGRLQRDSGGHNVPGFLTGESVAGWEARTGYTSENAINKGRKKGTKINLPGG